MKDNRPSRALEQLQAVFHHGQLFADPCDLGTQERGGSGRCASLQLASESDVTPWDCLTELVRGIGRSCVTGEKDEVGLAVHEGSPDVILKDCAVPGEFLLGKEGQGMELALGTLSRFRTSVAAAADGFARRALDESRAHLLQRRQGGRTLSKHQALRFDLAEMDVRLRAAQLLVDEAAERADAGLESTLEVARAKLFATEAAGWICDRAVQLHGGLGVKKGSVVERLYREVRALRIYEGTSEIQKSMIARLLLND